MSLCAIYFNSIEPILAGENPAPANSINWNNAMATAHDAAKHPTFGNELLNHWELIFCIQIGILIWWGRWMYIRHLNLSELQTADLLGKCGRFIATVLLVALAVRRFAGGGLVATLGVVPLYLAVGILRNSGAAINWIRWLVAGLAVLIFLGCINPFAVLDLDAAGSSVAGFMALALLASMGLVLLEYCLWCALQVAERRPA